MPPVEGARRADESSAGETYLIFSAGSERWAIRTSLVQEIMHSAKIHPLPFVPRYIEGVVNCRGLPYTVVNPLKIDGDGGEMNGGATLVFKREDDHFAIRISNIEVFFEPEAQDISDDGIKYKNRLVQFFDADYIEALLRRDLRDEELKEEEGL